MQELLGLEDDGRIVRSASGLGAGLGLQGAICGAVVGGALILGLRYGFGTFEEYTLERRMKPYGLCGEYYSRFKEKFGSCNCRDITEVDFTKPGAIEEFYSSGKAEECEKLVAWAVRLLVDMINEEETKEG